MKKSLVKEIIALIIVALILGVSFIVQLPINAAKNGHVVKKLDLTNNILIIGDSRMHQLYDLGKKASYVCVWGGHYGYGYNIISSENKKTIKKYINKIVEEHGNCRVIIEATINDYNGNGSYSSALNSLTKFAETAAGYNKNATIYTTCLIKEKNGKSVSDFNKALRKKAKKSSKYKYLNIKPKEVEYIDQYHFTKKTLKEIYKKIKAAS